MLSASRATTPAYAGGNFRPLSSEELDFVSGGLQDNPGGPGFDPIYQPAGSIIYGPCGYGWVTGEGALYQAATSQAPDPNEIVVVGTPMTDQQKAAYDSAYSRAWWDITASEMFGFGALIPGGAWGALAGMALGVLESRTGTAEDMTVALAEVYYDFDGADGTYDGVNDYDRYMMDYPNYD